MGCGSSSLKGDDPSTAAAPKPVPAPKPRQDFSSVDYDQEAQQRRLTEYAPHESANRGNTGSSKTSKKNSISGDPEHARDTEMNTLANRATTQDVEGTPEIKDASYPHEKVGAAAVADGSGQSAPVDQTKHQQHQQKSKKQVSYSSALDEKARPIDSQTSQISTPEIEKKRTSSSMGSATKWLSQKSTEYRDTKTGRNNKFTDEELQKYIGMDRKKLTQYMETRPGDMGRPGSLVGTGVGDEGLLAYSNARDRKHQ